MKNLFVNVLLFTLFWAVGAFSIAVGVWTLGHQSSTAFELAFTLFVVGSFCIAFPIHIVVNHFPRWKQ